VVRIRVCRDLVCVQLRVHATAPEVAATLERFGSGAAGHGTPRAHPVVRIPTFADGGKKGLPVDFSRPGKPTDKPFIESFNGSFRGECLNVHWFLSLKDAHAKIENWRQGFNDFRPHSVLSGAAPALFASQFNDSTNGRKFTV
jgi:transposase InsO family protein